MKRNYLAVLIAGLAVLALLLVGSMAGLGTVGADTTDEQPSDRTISVSANGQADAAPDTAVVTVGVTAEADDRSDVSDQLAERADELRERLDELGVDYQTEHFRIHESHGPDRESAGFEGVHAFRVTLEDTDAVGSVVDTAAEVGADVGNVQMTLSEDRRAELRDQAIQNAMGDARVQANTIADAANLDVTGVVTVDANQRSYHAASADTVAVEDSGASAPPTEIDMGDVTVTYSVQVTFEASA